MKKEVPTLVKWAGGKKQLIKQFKSYLPKKISRYLEPFVGGGAVAFYVTKNYKPKEIILSDTNEELINLYNVVKDNLTELIKILKQYKKKHSKETYYESLERSSSGWHEERHDPGPWMHYFYGTLIAAYKEFESRAGVYRKESSKTDQVKAFVDHAVIPFSITDIEHACPGISRDMIRLVLRELRDSGAIYVTGKGRGAKWVKK